MAEEEKKSYNVGNSFWKARSTHGRKPLWDNPEEFLESCTQYFEWVEKNPLWDTKPMIVDGSIQDAPTAKMRAMTLDGLSIFLGIARKTWDNYRAREDFLPVVSMVETVIRDQKFSGAAAGLLNSNIIARDLGLKDSSAVDLKVPEGLTFINNFGGKDES